MPDEMVEVRQQLEETLDETFPDQDPEEILDQLITVLQDGIDWNIGGPSTEEILQKAGRDGVPDLDDLKPRGPLTKTTQIGTITFDTFRVQHGQQSHFDYEVDGDERSFGVYAKTAYDVLDMPMEAQKALLDEMMVEPDISQASMADFRQFGAYEIEIMIEYIFIWSGMIRPSEEIEVEAKNGSMTLNWA